MAAVLHPHQQAPVRHLGGSAPAERPRLVVLEGGRSAAARARRRTYLRRRLAVGLLGLLGVAGAVQAFAAPSGPVAVLPRTHVVQAGETLWSIASALPVNADVRVLVSELAAANGGPGVRAGQELVIPAHLAELGS